MRRLCVLVVGALVVLGACTDGVKPPTSGIGDRCQQRPDQETKLKVGVEAGLQEGLLKFKGEAGYEQLVDVKNQFDTLQADFAQIGYQLCEDSATGAISQAYYERRRECLDKAMLAMRAMEKTLSAQPDSGVDLAWELESKMATIQNIVACDDKRPATVEVAPQAPEIELTAYLVCQRQTDQGWADVPDCTRAVLKEGDRVKIGFKVNQPSKLYILNYNSAGLFQMIFPDKGIPNEPTVGKDYLIPQNTWLTLDDEKGVIEHLQIVASVDPMAELEEMRGMRIEPGQGLDKPNQNRQAMRTRGLLEPVIARGFNVQKEPIRLEVGESEQAETIPMVTAGRGVSVIEFKIIHQ